MTITGTLADINTIALDVWSSHQPLNFNGSGAQITVSTNDQGYTGGGALSDSDVLAITVTAVNDPPTFTHNGDVTVPRIITAAATITARGPATFGRSAG